MPAQRVSRTSDKSASSNRYDAAQQLWVAPARRTERSGPRAGACRPRSGNSWCASVRALVRVGTMAALVPPETGARELAVVSGQLEVRAGGCGHERMTVTRHGHLIPLPVVAMQRPLAAGPVSPPMRPRESGAALAITKHPSSRIGTSGDASSSSQPVPHRGLPSSSRIDVQ